MDYITINKDKINISSNSKTYKTEQFVKQTKGLVDLDAVLNIISFALLPVLKKYDINKALLIETLDGENKFFIKRNLKNELNCNIKNNDIVFYKYVGKEKQGKRIDRRFSKYVNDYHSNDVRFKVQVIEEQVNDVDFNKLYVLSNSDQVNFPLLNSEQEKIVRMEDNNVLIQGVAGSGKTNICIDKIVYSACRHYQGKVLYSTYSHGLLEDTKQKVELFNYNIKNFIEQYKKGNVFVLDKNIKLAVENYLGVWLEGVSDNDCIKELELISQYLSTKVDYLLLEDLYEDRSVKIANEETFIKEYIPGIKNYNIAANLDKLKNITLEIVYKEVYGIIFGCCDSDNVKDVISLDEYKQLRKESFSSVEINTIYLIAQDFGKYLRDNKYEDNNSISKKILDSKRFYKYSLVILDEVQDFTQKNLCLFKQMAIKMFCVGDVLQMINPTYFSVAYLKRLMFKEDAVNVIELTHNYRNSEKIETIVDKLSALNINQFGTHNFVLKGTPVKNEVNTRAVYVNDGNFTNYISKNVFNDLTIVVGSKKKKDELHKILPKQEVLTISEIKGLERNSILLVDILSDNIEKWDSLQRNIVNKKKAEENSIYRYYFNLLYVGMTRAKNNLFINERRNVELFKSFFASNFEVMSVVKAYETLVSTVGKVEVDEDELFNRINEFIKLEQYDNARFIAQKLPNADDYKEQSIRINVYEKFVRNRKYRDAGIAFWQSGLFEDAKNQFKLAGDEKLIQLVDACVNNNGQKLEYDIVQFYPDVQDNKEAVDLILETLSMDVDAMKLNQKEINEKITKIKNNKKKR